MALDSFAQIATFSIASVKVFNRPMHDAYKGHHYICSEQRRYQAPLVVYIDRNNWQEPVFGDATIRKQTVHNLLGSPRRKLNLPRDNVTLRNPFGNMLPFMRQGQP
jgi:hypothetical protein